MIHNKLHCSQVSANSFILFYILVIADLAEYNKQYMCLLLSCSNQRTLEKETRQCQALIIWTDCDREGENIGFEIIDVCKAGMIITRVGCCRHCVGASE